MPRPFDVVRVIVLIEVAVMALLFLSVTIRDVRVARTIQPRDSSVVSLAWGRACGAAGIAIMLAVLSVGILGRIGHRHVTPLTPVTQIALLLLLGAYILRDRRSLHPARQVRNPAAARALLKMMDMPDLKDDE